MVKHVALVALILCLRRKEKPFCVVDAHAGAGLYDLGGAQAARTGEAEQGIARLGDLEGPSAPPAMRTYLDIVRAEGTNRYPGSSRIAARLLRPQDRLVAIEEHPGEAAALRVALADFRNARVVEGDAREQLPALLPPPERRGLVLIDPSYEAADEFERIAELLAKAHRRFATGIYLLWFPIKSTRAADALSGEVRAWGVGPALRLDFDVGAAPAAEKDRLSAAGLLVVGPPYGFEAEMDAAMAALAPRLGRTPAQPARFSLVRW